MSDYKNLFRGAARLGVMVGALDIPFQRTSHFVEALSEELDGYQAMRVCADEPALGVTTRGAGQGFVHRCARLMDDAGIPEEELRRFLVRAKRFDHQGLEFGADWMGPDAGGFSYRLRTPHELELAKAMLLDGGADADGLSRLDDEARAAGRDRVQALSCRVDLLGGRREEALLGRVTDDEAGDCWLAVGPWGELRTYEDVPGDWAGERGETLVAVFGKAAADRGHLLRPLEGPEVRWAECERTG